MRGNEAQRIGRWWHPVKVRSIIVSGGLKDVHASRDDVTREIHDKDDFLIGQMFVDHECLKVWAQYDGDFTAGAIKICRDSLLVRAFVGCQVDVPKPRGSVSR